MSRPRRDGTPAAKPNKKRLTNLMVKRLRKGERPLLIWDTLQPGLALRILPSGKRPFKAIYSRNGRPRWFNIGEVSLGDARKRAMWVRSEVAHGRDPQAERRAERSAGTFAELADQYVEWAKKPGNNKSWRQARRLVTRYLLPKWSKLKANSISRADMQARLQGLRPILANQVLASASAIFTWGIEEEIVTVNPCLRVKRNPTTSRARILSDSEIPLFWKALDDVDPIRAAALRTILLTGQRPGEVAQMRSEDIKDGWWEMPGKAEGSWPGTKNKREHAVWLPKPALEILETAPKRPGPGLVFGKVPTLDKAMREVVAKLKLPRATPHDLRRTHGSTITALGFGRASMNRAQNHKEGGIGDVYDRYEYADENKRIMEAVAIRIIGLATGETVADNVVRLK